MELLCLHTGGRLGKELDEFACLEYTAALEVEGVAVLEFRALENSSSTVQLGTVTPDSLERVARAASRCALTTHVLIPLESGPPAELTVRERLAVRPYEVSSNTRRDFRAAETAAVELYNAGFNRIDMSQLECHTLIQPGVYILPQMLLAQIVGFGHVEQRAWSVPNSPAPMSPSHAVLTGRCSIYGCWLSGVCS